MAYVDHAFSISDEDIMMETSYTVNNRPPIKEVVLAISLPVFGTFGITCGIVMAYNRVGGDRAHVHRQATSDVVVFSIFSLVVWFHFLGFSDKGRGREKDQLEWH